jgi:hypothetical protein
MTRAKLLVTICQIGWSRSLEYARCGLQNSVVAENDRKERRWAFMRLLNAFGFENLKRILHQILAMNLYMQHSLSGDVI